jgi:hypothetical protein
MQRICFASIVCCILIARFLLHLMADRLKKDGLYDEIEAVSLSHSRKALALTYKRYRASYSTDPLVIAYASVQAIGILSVISLLFTVSR